MPSTAQPPQVFYTQREFNFTAEEIFAAFAAAERLAAWWGPSGFTNTFEQFEFIENGLWKFVMHGPDGTNYPNEAIFSTIEAGKKIVIRHTNMPNFTLTVTLQAKASACLLTWLQEFDDAQFAANVRAIVEPANEQNLDRLQLHLQGELI